MNIQNTKNKKNKRSNRSTNSNNMEFYIVYILNVNEGSIHYRKAFIEEAVEEERLLFYVGMTRARKKLVLAYVKRQYEKEREPSRFLEETGL